MKHEEKGRELKYCSLTPAAVVIIFFGYFFGYHVNPINSCLLALQTTSGRLFSKKRIWSMPEGLLNIKRLRSSVEDAQTCGLLGNDGTKAPYSSTAKASFIFARVHIA